MRTTLLAVAMLVGVAVAGKSKNVDDFPVKFLVRSETMATEFDKACHMELEAGNMRYSVSQAANPMIWKFCSTLTPGQEIHGRIQHHGNYIELYYQSSGSSFKHQYGEWKTTKWRIDTSYTV